MKRLLAVALLALCSVAQAQDTSVFWKSKLTAVSLASTNDQYAGCGGVAVAVHTVLTSKHCFDGTLVLINGQKTTATLLANDGETGEAVLLSVPAITFRHVAPLAKKLAADYGQDVFMWGQPLGSDWTLRKGYRAGTWNKQLYNDKVRPTHAYHSYVMEVINGDSGSPIFNMKGEVVGIVGAKRTWAEYWPDGDVAKTYSLAFSVPLLFTKKQWKQAGVAR